MRWRIAFACWSRASRTTRSSCSTRTGTSLTWNAGAERIKGYTADEIIGKHFSIFYPPEDDRARASPSASSRSRPREGRFEDEGWRVRKDGTRFWANVVITALRDPTGTLVGFAKVTRDLTERRAAEEALRRARSAFGCSSRA